MRDFEGEEPTVEYPRPENMAEAIEWWTELWRAEEGSVVYQLGTNDPR